MKRGLIQSGSLLFATNVSDQLLSLARNILLANLLGVYQMGLASVSWQVVAVGHPDPAHPSGLYGHLRPEQDHHP